MKKTKMRFAVFIRMALCCLILTAGVTFSARVSLPAAAEEKPTLRVYNWGEYIANGDDDSRDLIQEFRDQNPDINVEYSTFATNEEMYTKIASGSANYDVLIPSDYMIGKMIGEGMLAKLNFDNIPNYQYIDEQFRHLEYDPDGAYSVPYTWGTVGIVYNTTMVEEPVTSWDILWDEKYAGQILMFDNVRDAYGIAMKKLGYSQNATDPAQIDEATELLKEQKPLVQAYVMDQIFQKMPNGEAALAPYYAGDFYTMQADNPDLAFAVPEEGTNLFVDAMCVLESSEHKDLAERFINFMCDPDVALANIEFIGYSTPMTVVREQLDPEMRDSAISYPSDEILAKCDTFITLDDDTNAYYQDAWTEVKTSSGEGENIGAIILLCVVVAAVIALVVFLYIRKKRNA